MESREGDSGTVGFRVVRARHEQLLSWCSVFTTPRPMLYSPLRRLGVKPNVSLLSILLLTSSLLSVSVSLLSVSVSLLSVSRARFHV